MDKVDLYVQKINEYFGLSGCKCEECQARNLQLQQLLSDREDQIQKRLTFIEKQLDALLSIFRLKSAG